MAAWPLRPGGCCLVSGDGPTDPDELLELWLQYEPRFRARAQNILTVSSAVEDVVQEAFLKVYRNADHIRDKEALQYCMRSASNVARDAVRRYRRKPTCELPENLEISNPPDQLERCYARERHDLYEQVVRPALEVLPQQEREAVAQILVDQTQKAVADSLGIPPSTFSSRRRQGLEKLLTMANPWR